MDAVLKSGRCIFGERENKYLAANGEKNRGNKKKAIIAQPDQVDEILTEITEK